MIVREAMAEDAAQIIAHVNRISEEPNRTIVVGPGEFKYTLEQERNLLAEYAASDNSLYLVAVIESHIVGILNCEGGKRQANRHNASLGISIAHEWRSQGIGTALMERLLEWASRTPVIRRLELEVFAHNAAAIHLYRKCGFVEEGRRQSAFFLNGEFVDSILMARLM